MKNFLFLGLMVLCLSCANKSSTQDKTDAVEQQSSTTYTVGNCQITTLSEGEGDGKIDILIGASPEILSQCAPDGTFPIATNAFLVRTPEKTILVDAGYGKQLFDNMLTQNVSPEQVDIILLTHAHGDHIGGLLRDGNVAFPNAELYMSQAEHDYWINNQENGEQAQAIIEAYKDKLHLFVPTDITSGGINILPEFRAIATPGHTPGHTVFLLESENDKVLIWGDLTHAMTVQMPYPEIAVTYDVDPELAIATRKQVLDFVAKQDIPVAGMHIVSPAIGHIVLDGNGYQYTEKR